MRCLAVHPLSLVALCSSLLVACSCGENGNGGATGGGAGAGSSSSGGSSSSSSSGTGATGAGATTSGSGGGGGVIAEPCPGWEGWETWDDFAPDGPFCVPASSAALPEAIGWEECDPIVGMAAGCRQMAITWQASVQAIAPISGWVEPDGTVLLHFARNAKTDPAGAWRMLVTGEVDGPVRSAFLDASWIQNSTWGFWGATEFAGMRQGRYVFRIRRNDLNEDFEEAIVGGAVGELRPQVLQVWGSTDGHAIGASSGLWAARTPSQLQFAAWGAPLGPPITSSEVGGGEQVGLFPFGDFAVWSREFSVGGADFWAYKAGVGAYPLVEFGGDPLKNAAGFGTDGVHMVWVQTEVNVPYDQTPYEIGPRDLMVSPYSETAAGLSPVRIRSFPSIYPLIAPLAVGCGYAAHGGAETGNAWLFRLSDGAMWQLPTAGCTPPSVADDGCFGFPLVVSCEEAFFYTVGKRATISRVAIDALGPPIPPD